MKIVPSTPKMVQTVAALMRDADLGELMAVTGHRDHFDLAAALGSVHGDNAIVICADDGAPVAVLTNHIPRPGTLSLGMFATDRWPEVARSASRWCVTTYRPELLARFHRLEAASIEGHDVAHRWLEFLGFSREAVMPKFGRNGETFYLYGMTDDVLSPCHVI